MRHRHASLAAAAVALLLAAVPAHAQQGGASCPWMDGSKTPEARADLLISHMSLDQKVHQTTFSLPPWFAHYGTAGHVDADPALCIPEINMSDAGSGVVGLQQGTTVFPSGVAQAATWDPVLERRFGAALADEAFAKGINVMLGPGMNIARIATNGRNFEYFGEDPFLAGKTAAAAIRGIQSRPVLAEAKHFAANNQETDRTTVNSVVDERTLREIYLPAFEASVKEGHVGSVMCSYNKLNGRWACENPELLDGFLRRDWGFDGFVTSDWGATHTTLDSARSGLDLEMFVAPPQYYGQALGDAVKSGQIPESRVDTMLRHIFVPMFRVGLFDNPVVPQPNAYFEQAATPAHRSLAREVSEASTVLLKNEGDILPLDRGHGRTIAVIGTAANPVGSAGSSGGGGSSHGTGLPAPVSPLEGITTVAQTHGDNVVYADGSLGADAAAVARTADYAIVFVADSESEGSDNASLDMNGAGVCAAILCGGTNQDENSLVSTVAAANPRTIVVVDAGRPVAMPWLSSVKGVLDAWYPGLENGNAIANVLYGGANPSGHLPQSFPRSLGDMPERSREQYPGVNLEAKYTEGLLVGYRWFDAKGIEPLFPFGFGLSYTTFSFSGLKLAQGGDGATVTYTVTNTGRRAGADVSQVYVGFPSALGEPPKQLKGYRKVDLEPGESQTVTVPLDKRAFSYWSPAKHDWAQSSSCYGIQVGDSSRSLPLSGVMRLPLTVRLRGVKRVRVRSVTVYLNGKRLRTQRTSAKTVRIVLDPRTRRTSRVRFVVRTTRGRKIVDRRSYRPCRRS
jgi:beta-glucosidase